MDTFNYSNPILLFDGTCNLCNRSVKFILKHEKKTDILFASLQSEVGIKLLTQYGIETDKIDSLILIQNNKVYIKSSAALRLTWNLKGLYPIFYLFLIIPYPLRNLVYDYTARKRYKWFGKSDYCMVPQKEYIHRFL